MLLQDSFSSLIVLDKDKNLLLLLQFFIHLRVLKSNHLSQTATIILFQIGYTNKEEKNVGDKQHTNTFIVKISN